MLRASLWVVLILTAAICTFSAPQEYCKRDRELYLEDRLPIRFLAPVKALLAADLVIQTVPVKTLFRDLKRPHFTAEIACVLKGCLPLPQRQQPMAIRVTPARTECISIDAMTGLIETAVARDGGANSADYVVALQRNGTVWELLEGGLFPADDFYRRTPMVCNLKGAFAVAKLSGCQSRRPNIKEETQAADCKALNDWAEILGVKESSRPAYLCRNASPLLPRPLQTQQALKRRMNGDEITFEAIRLLQYACLGVNDLGHS